MENQKEKNWKEEFDKCINGCTVDGKKLTGMHYFYLNYIKVNGKAPIYNPSDAYFFNMWNKVSEEINGYKSIPVFWLKRPE